MILQQESHGGEDWKQYILTQLQTIQSKQVRNNNPLLKSLLVFKKNPIQTFSQTQQFKTFVR